MSSTVPSAIAEFLEGHRIVVAGVSRDGRHAANAILRRLSTTGHEALPVNPRAGRIDGAPCYPDVASVPGPVDGVVVVTPPEAAEDVVRQCVARGIRRIWFHRAFGAGSVSAEAVAACRSQGIEPIVGGCPLMFCGSVDLGHRCLRWWTGRRGYSPS